MFTSTPAARLRKPNRRQSGGLVQDTKLPYVSPITNFSYGSQAANVPKPPRIADTKVKLSEGLQAVNEASEARRAEEAAAREREAEKRRAETAMPPPPARMTRSRSRSAAPEQSAEPEREPSPPFQDISISRLTSFDPSRSFSTEFAIDPVMSGKVRETEVGYSLDAYEEEDDGNDGDTIADDPVDYAKDLSETSPNKDVSTTEYRNGTTNGVTEQEDDFDYTPIPIAEDSPQVRPSTSGSATRKTRTKETAERSKTRSRSRRASKTPGRPRRRSILEDKENSVMNRKPRANAEEEEVEYDGYEVLDGEHHEERLDYYPSTRLKPPVTPLSRKDPPYVASPPGPPSMRTHPFDWIFYQWHNWIKDRVRVFWQLVAFGMLLVFLFNSARYFQDKGFGGLRSPWFHAPDAPPENWGEFTDRLHKLEKSLSAQAGHKDLIKAQHKESQTLLQKIEELRKDVDKLKTGSATTGTSLRDIEIRLKNSDDKIRQYMNAYKTVEDKIKHLEKDINPAALRKQLDETLRTRLPKELLADVKKDGSVEFTSDFKKAMEDTFQSFFPAALGKHLPDHLGDIKGAAPSWESFMKSNAEKLRTTIDDHVKDAVKNIKGAVGKASKGNPSQVSLTRDTVLQLIQPEIDSMQKKWETETLSSLKKQQSSSLESIRTEADKLARSIANQAANRVLNSLPTNSPSSSILLPGPTVPDYANQLAGARVWPYLTSPSYNFAAQHGRLPRLLGWIWETSGGRAPHPGVALMPSSDYGDCWPFAGRKGTLAIKLPEPIFPKYITIEHGFKRTSPDTSSTPKTFHIWARVKDPAKRDKLQRAVFREQNLPENTSPSPVLLDGKSDAYSDFVKVHEFTYALDGAESQNFMIPVDMAQLGVMTNVIAIVMTDNWGNDDYTCLYRTKVLGYGRKNVPEEYKEGLRKMEEEEERAREEARRKRWWKW